MTILNQQANQSINQWQKKVIKLAEFPNNQTTKPIRDLDLHSKNQQKNICRIKLQNSNNQESPFLTNMNQLKTTSHMQNKTSKNFMS